MNQPLTLEERLAMRDRLIAENAVARRKLAAFDDLLAAAEAGGRYSDALLSLQNQFPLVKGTTVQSVDLDALFRDWHDKTHAAIKKARPE